MSIVLYSRDLMASSKLSPVAANLGTVCTVASQPAALMNQLNAGGVRVVVIDLNSVGEELTTLVAAVKARSDVPAVIAFGPHVHETKLDAASAAGCDRVYTRGQFHAQAGAILRSFIAE